MCFSGAKFPKAFWQNGKIGDKNKAKGFFLMGSGWIEKQLYNLKLYIKSRSNKSHRAIR